MRRVHHVYMAKRDKGPGHYLRQWRDKFGWSQQEVIDRLELLGAERADPNDPLATPVSLKRESLSRIESGKQPYNQRLLELLAEVYGTTPDALIRIDPGKPDLTWNILEALKPAERQAVIEYAEFVKNKRTGTGGR